MGAIDKPAAEVDVDEALVRSLLADQHPDLADRPLHAVGEGWDNVLWRIGVDLLARLPRRQLGAVLVDHERRWLPRLAPILPLPIPAPIRTGHPTAAYPWSWLIVPWLPGEVAATTPPTDPAAAAVALGRFVAALHLPAPSDAPGNPWRGGPLETRDARLRDALDQLGDEVDRAAILRVWADARDAPVWEGPAVWLHGDLHPANLLVHDGVLSAVIDFGDLTAGDPATDLMVAWMLFGPEDRPAFRSAAASAVDPVEDATWRRARGWALAHSLVCIANSADAPVIAAIGRRTLRAVLADPELGR